MALVRIYTNFKVNLFGMRVHVCRVIHAGDFKPGVRGSIQAGTSYFSLLFFFVI